MQRQHLNDTVEELKRFNARRKLKGAVQAIASGVALDPLCCTDIDAGKLHGSSIISTFFMWRIMANLIIIVSLSQIQRFCLFVSTVNVGQASESLNEWADEDAGIEAVQKIVDTLDDIAALQDTEIDPDVLISMLRDNKLHNMLQVN